MKKILRYDENPFIGKTEITTRKKTVIIGKGNNVLIDQDTGEYSTTNIASYRYVDDEQFIKLFTQNIGLMFELTSAGNKAFIFLSWSIQKYSIGKDLVPLTTFELENFIKENKKYEMSIATMRRGIRELAKAQIIAPSKKIGVYYINPNFIFNGDRLRFVTEIRRKGKNFNYLNIK